MSRDEQVHLIGRRQVLRRLGGLGALGLFPGLVRALSPEAQAAGSYRALVCVFLFGGNDGNNTVVPTDSPGYGRYLLARGNVVGTPGNGALALADAGTTGGVLPLDGIPFGLHPAMPELRTLWSSGNVALLFNVGALVRPITVSEYLANGADPAVVPESLFSHINQQQQMQTTSLPGISTTGWAGRMGDELGNAGASVPVGVSVAGNTLFLAGASSDPIVLPQTGSLAYNGFNGTAASQARLAALRTLLGSGAGSALMAAAGGLEASAMAAADLLAPVLSGASTLASFFPTTNGNLSSLSHQLLQVARMIQAATTGAVSAPSRQIFFVDLQGFDTHNDQLNRQAPLLADLSASLAGFYNAMVSLGLQDDVVAFTLSDFSRTLKPASGGGSDHAWGSQQLVVGGGGAVRSGTYGTFPDLVLGGGFDVSSEGRWLPGLSIDQYGATLGRWVGLSEAQLATAFPNLANFTPADLGFLA